MSLPMRLEDLEEWEKEKEYARQYGGEKKFMSDLVEYEKITGKGWDAALEAFDPVSHSLIKFHKEVVLPLLRKGP